MEPAPRLVVRLLGEPQIVFDGEPWTVWMPPRCLLILASIALRLDESVTRATLAASIWPDELDSDARTNLRRHLYELQRGLPPIDGVDWILHEGKSLRWNDRAPARVDVRTFLRAGRDDPQAAIDAYGGELLEGIVDEAVLGERERLAALYRQALTQAMAAAQSSHDAATTIRVATALLAADEWREDALRALMSAAYLDGDASAALNAFDGFVRRLEDAFGTAPTPETIALRDAIRANLPLPGAAEPFDETLSEREKRAWNIPFAGRDDELTRLTSLWTRAARGAGTTAFVSGEAGIGKSRIAAELAAAARAQGATVLRGTTSEPEATPYQAILNALRSGLALFAQAPPQMPWLRRLAHLLPELEEVVPDAGGAGEGGSVTSRVGLYEAIASAIAFLARVRPLCVVLEDLHWAGPATLDAIESLARRIGALPVMLVATYRSEESSSGHPVRSLRAKLVRERRAVAVPLERLGEDDVATIIASVMQRTDDRELEARVVRLSEGNPLFVAQLVHAYRESGVLPDEAAALRSAGDAIALRIAGLGAEVRAIAQTAATLEQPFRSEAVADAGEWSAQSVSSALDSLMDRALIGEAGAGGGYVFTHALVAAACYADADEATRAQRHLRIAAMLRRNPVPSSLAAIARHLDHGGAIGDAAPAYVAAARAAFDIFAREEAVAAAHRAFELTADDRMRFEAMKVSSAAQSSTVNRERYAGDIERMERAAANLGVNERFEALRMRERYAGQIVDFEMHARVVADLERLAAESGERRHAAYASFSRGYLHMQDGEVQEAARRFEVALELSAQTDFHDDTARFREELVHTLMHAGEIERAFDEAERHKAFIAEHALPEQRRLGIYSNEAIFASLAEDPAWIERAANDLLDFSRRIGDEFNEGKAHMLLGQSFGLRYDMAAMREHERLGFELLQRVGDFRAAAVCRISHAEMEIQGGRVDLAEQLLGETSGVFAQFEPSDFEAVALVARAEASFAAGRFDESLERASAAQAAMGSRTERRFVADVSSIIGAAEWGVGQFENAVAHLREAMTISIEMNAPKTAAFALCWALEASRAAGDAGQTVTFASELERRFSEQPELFKRPTIACWALARYYGSSDPQAARSWQKAGAVLVREAVARMREPADKSAFEALFYNRELLEAQAAARP